MKETWQQFVDRVRKEHGWVKTKVYPVTQIEYTDEELEVMRKGKKA